MDKVIFFHMNQLGDFMFCLPVLEAARREWPDKKIYSYIRPELGRLAKATGFVDEIIEKGNGFGLRLNETALIKKESISKAILFSESPESVLVSLVCGIPERSGFESASLSFFLTQKSKKSGVPSLKNNMNLGLGAGLKNIRKDYSGLVKIPDKEKAVVDGWLSQKKIDPSRLIALSPGTSSRRKEKTWQKEKWLELIGLLIDKNRFVVLCGSPQEKGELENISKEFKERVSIFADFGIIALGALLVKSKLFLGVDSGAMHLAASLKTKVAALFGPTDPLQVGPQPLENHIIIRKDSMSQIEISDVWERIRDVS